jgi:hypothetical protein
MAHMLAGWGAGVVTGLPDVPGSDRPGRPVLVGLLLPEAGAAFVALLPFPLRPVRLPPAVTIVVLLLTTVVLVTALFVTLVLLEWVFVVVLLELVFVLFELVLLILVLLMLVLLTLVEFEMFFVVVL